MQQESTFTYVCTHTHTHTHTPYIKEQFRHTEGRFRCHHEVDNKESRPALGVHPTPAILATWEAEVIWSWFKAKGHPQARGVRESPSKKVN
jgi:hypothetical protein